MSVTPLMLVGALKRAQQAIEMSADAVLPLEPDDMENDLVARLVAANDQVTVSLKEVLEILDVLTREERVNQESLDFVNASLRSAQGQNRKLGNDVARHKKTIKSLNDMVCGHRKEINQLEQKLKDATDKVNVLDAENALFAEALEKIDKYDPGWKSKVFGVGDDLKPIKEHVDDGLDLLIQAVGLQEGE